MPQSQEKPGDRTPDGKFAKGNKLRMKDGRYARLPLGGLPPCFRRLERSVYRLRRELEAACVAKFGRINPARMTAIYRTCRHLLAAELISRRLTSQGLTLEATVLAECVGAMGRQLASVQEAIESLGLDEQKQADALSGLYSLGSEGLGSESSFDALDSGDAAASESGAGTAGSL